MVSCGKCGPMANCAMGPASECEHECSSQGYKWCARCALAKRVCQVCGASLPQRLQKKPDRRKDKKDKKKRSDKPDPGRVPVKPRGRK